LTQRIAAAPIKPRARSDPAPLSFAQERLWFLEQLEPESSVYNICRASRLLGKLNTSALEASLNEIISRHETLRTAFRLVDGRPIQVVQPIQNISIEYVDLRAIPDDERDAGIQRRIKAESDCPFDLSAGLLLRSTLLRAGDQEHVLILMTHHSASDAWSMGILTRELWTLYQAFSNGNPSPLEPLPVQYSDYAVWQRDWLQGEVLKGQLSYWKEQLKDLPILNLPTDRPRKPRQSFHGARLAISLPEVVTSALNEMCHRHAVTPFMTLLATLQVLLYRYTGQEDFAVGSPIANRRRPEVEGLIGVFVNTLVLRANFSGISSFKDLLLQTKGACLAADANQDLPFEKLVQELQPERDQSRNPLFQVMFVLQNATRPFSGIPGLRIEPLEMATTRTPFDLSFFLRERDGKDIGYIEYSTDLFDRSTIERMIGHFQILLEGIVAYPDQPISRLPILTESEHQQILIEWNDTAPDYPRDKCIHQLFEEQAEKTPDGIALEFEGKEITYRDLNRKANQLAHYLISLGIGPEKLVGICIERSVEMVIALLGILKAGGAYVPLDPAYPKERLEFMLEDARVSVLLTQQKLLQSMPLSAVTSQPSDTPEVICFDRDCESISQESEDNPHSNAHTSNAAYVIYTSGSTGQPKGVVIEHRNTVAFLHWAKNVFTNDELAGVLSSTSICFDLSIFELFAPLSGGGKVVLMENALCLLENASAKEVRLVNTVPSVMTALLSVGRLPDSIHTVNLAGELLQSELVKQIYESTRVEKVYDLYGPSEATTYSTFTLRTAEGPPTIGRAISNTRIYILDRNLQPVPIGVAGELYIGGAGVARGYLNRPELSLETFILNPFNDEPNSRLYRTGDLARYRWNGNIEFLGRVDNQVKIRGYRIELGEIEAVLNQHPAVKDGVVVSREDVTEEESGADNLQLKIDNLKSRPRLVAYVVPIAHQPAIDQLRGFLKEKLPHYMMPSAFVMLDTLPLLPNGKVDRQKLPPPDGWRPDLTREFVPSRTEIEEVVAQVCKEVLKVRNLGINDNFFELGGHSLLAVQIISRLRDVFNREIPLRVLFETPTVAGLGVTVENLIRGGCGPELPPIVPVSRDVPLPLSLNQEHLWHLDQMIPGTPYFNMPFVYQLSGDLNIAALEKALREIVRRHEALRTVFANLDGQPVQIFKDGTDFQLHLEDLRAEAIDYAAQRAAALILEERERPFDLATGPLLRTKLLCLKETEHLLLLTMHHIISDHWSMHVLRRELGVLYSAFSKGRSSPLPEPPIQFADYAGWEKWSLDKSVLNRQLDYWKKQLAGPLPEIEVQKKNKRKRRLSFLRSRLPIDLDETLFTRIKRLAQTENCTPFMVVVTALNIVLYLYSGQQDIRIGTLVANRGRREIERTIGHFLNTVILRIQVLPDMTHRQLLRQVRHTTFAAYAHQELPFEQLARVLEKEQKILRPSLFEVLLDYQSRGGESDDRAGLSFAPFDIEQTGPGEKLTPTTFALILNLRESSTRLTGTVTYRDDMFNSSAIVSLTECFRWLLESIVVDKDSFISSFKIGLGQRLVTGGVLWHGGKARP
jgi:amino acid adenylation domain-containing protein